MEVTLTKLSNMFKQTVLILTQLTHILLNKEHANHKELNIIQIKMDIKQLLQMTGPVSLLQ